MSWTAPMTAVANATFFAAEWNTYIRDNLLATEVARASVVGAVMARNDVISNAVQEQQIVHDYVEDSINITTLGVGFTPAPDGLGPTVSTVLNNGAICILNGAYRIFNSGDEVYSSIRITGASLLSPSFDRALIQSPYSSGVVELTHRSGAILPIPASVVGGVTITAEYSRVGAGTGVIAERNLIVIPL